VWLPSNIPTADGDNSQLRVDERHWGSLPPDVIANTTRVERYTRAQEIYDLRAVAATFDAAELNRTRVRGSDSKWQTRGQLHARE
jgi:hypothetical protein